MRHTEVDDPGCPYCGAPNDDAADVLGDKRPRDGDYAFCGFCAEVGIFEYSPLGRLRSRRATPEEERAAKSRPEYINWVKALRATHRQHGI